VYAFHKKKFQKLLSKTQVSFVIEAPGVYVINIKTLFFSRKLQNFYSIFWNVKKSSFLAEILE
jgi:hypothetical protein